MTTSTVSGNHATATSGSGGDVGGGILSEGGSVTFRTVTDDCNAATTAGDGSNAGGGILSEGGNVTTNAGSIVGNTATATGGGTAGAQVQSLRGHDARWATRR